MRYIYREVQYFRQWWLWVLILPWSLFTIWGMFQQLVLGIPFGTNPASDTGMLVIGLVFGIGFPIAFYFMGLVTEIREDGISVRFKPFHLSFRKFLWMEIESIEVRKYNAFKEFGGWGIRWGAGGKAYNVAGDMGIQLTFKNGKKLLIGTAKEKEIMEAIKVARGE